MDVDGERPRGERRGLGLPGRRGRQKLYGHHASYTSNNVNNGREDFAWSDADAAVNQPWLLPSLLVGMSWSLYPAP